MNNATITAAYAEHDMGQDPAEIRWFADLVAARSGPQTYVEIGSRGGGSLLVIASVLPIGSMVVGVDLPGAAWGHADSLGKLLSASTRIEAMGVDCRLVLGDSHSPATARDVRVITRGMIDILLIDGDHAYEAAREDYLTYSPMVRPGGLIAFHDVAEPPPRPDIGVGRLFREVCVGRAWRSHVDQPCRFGIGVVVAGA